MFKYTTFRKSGIAAFCVLSVAVTHFPTPVQSQEFNWNGISVYGGVGASRLDGDFSVADTTTYSIATECDVVPNQGFLGIFSICLPLGPAAGTIGNNATSSDSDIGALGTVGLGADFEIAPGVVIGAFADADISNAKVNFSSTSTTALGPFGFVNGTTTVAGEMEHQYSLSVGGRLGVLSTSRQALIYVLAAYTEAHFDNPTASITNSVTGPFGNTFSGDPIAVGLPDKYRGLTLGVGTEVKLSNIWSLKIEGRYTDLQARTVNYSGATDVRTSLGFTESGPGCTFGTTNDCEAFLRTTASSNGSIKIDPNLLSARIALTLKLN